MHSGFFGNQSRSCGSIAGCWDLTGRTVTKYFIINHLQMRPRQDPSFHTEELFDRITNRRELPDGGGFSRMPGLDCSAVAAGFMLLYSPGL
jgi:hypothetical protein